MAGGPSTPALAVAVSEAGGLGFLAAGYRTAEGVRDEIRAVRAQTARPFGLNLLLVEERPVDRGAVERYASLLEAEADRYGVALGAPAFDDDGRAEKLALAVEERVGVVSFAFACPRPDEVEALHAAGAQVWVTVTAPHEARAAEAADADALIVQGAEAGGHRGTFDDSDEPTDLRALLAAVAAVTGLPLVAAGAITTRAHVEEVLGRGAVAAQVGTAFLLCDEAGTSAPHRRALADLTSTRLTRAFTGRRARGLVNRFMTEHDDQAPAAYPHIHALTAPIRRAARDAGDPGGMHLWAGTGFADARAVPAKEVVRALTPC